MKNTIHYAFILDQSGSMLFLKKVVVDSFNEQVSAIRKLKKENPNSEIKCTWCVFNDEVEYRLSSADACNLKKIKPEDYQPNSCTALYDAIGATYQKIEKDAGLNDQVFFAVFTDGMENASKHFSADDIKEKLSMAEKKGWKVRFFCRLEEGAFYRRNLHLHDDNMINITLNEAGIHDLNYKICCSLREMVIPYNDSETPEGILE